MNPQVSPGQSAPTRLSRTQSGAALVLLAVVLGFTPWFDGPRLGWSIVLIVMGAAIFSGRVPSAMQSTLAPVFALCVVAHAFHLWAFGIGWIPWFVASWLLVADQWHRLDWQSLRGGYRLYVPIGVAICLLSLLSTWDRSADSWSFGWAGGLQYQSHFNSLSGSWEMQPTYVPTLYTNNFWWPGFEFSGRAYGGAVLVEIGLIAIASWAAWRDPSAQYRARVLPLLAIAAIAFWALPTAKAAFAAPHWFLLGLALCGFGVWKVGLGQNRGAFDPADVAQRVRQRIR